LRALQKITPSGVQASPQLRTTEVVDEDLQDLEHMISDFSPHRSLLQNAPQSASTEVVASIDNDDEDDLLLELGLEAPQDELSILRQLPVQTSRNRAAEEEGKGLTTGRHSPLENANHTAAVQKKKRRFLE